jgi:hypothetical protein
MVKAASGEDSAPGTALAAAMATDSPSPSNNLTWEGLDRWVVGMSLDGNGG